METATNIGPILQINYRCDQVIKDNQDGDILWMGPSERQIIAVETEPRDFLIDPLLVDTMKQQIFNYLRTQPFVQTLLQEGDTLGMAQCEILYKDNTTGFWAAMNQDNLSINQSIHMEIDELGPYAQLWITMTLIVNSPEPAHLVKHFGPDPSYHDDGNGYGYLAAAIAIRAQEAQEDDSDDDSVVFIEEIITIED